MVMVDDVVSANLSRKVNRGQHYEDINGDVLRDNVGNKWIISEEYIKQFQNLHDRRNKKLDKCKQLLQSEFKVLGKRERRILNMRLHNYTEKEIAGKIKISQPAVCKALVKISNKLKRQFIN